jgi:hypothetical protein
MAVDRMRNQCQYFALQYWVSEEAALKAREVVRSRLDLDEFCSGAPGFSYPLHDLYLDSDGLEFYRANRDKSRNRFKLCLRSYCTTGDAPIFFEIRRWINGCIFKQRAGVRQEFVEALLRGAAPKAEFLHPTTREPKSLVALENFSKLSQQIGAKPKVDFYHLREAYGSSDRLDRVTIDRKFYGDAHRDYDWSKDGVEPKDSCFSYAYDWGGAAMASGSGRESPGFAVVQLKFTRRIPEVFRELVSLFGRPK